MASSDKNTANAINQLSNNITNASNENSAAINDAASAIVNAVQDLGQGLKLTDNPDAEKDNKKEKNDKKEKDLKAQLDGLRIFAPELANIVDELLEINLKLLKDTDKQNNKKDNNKKDKEEKTEFDTSAKETDKLAGVTGIANITGVGFSIVGNLLTDISNNLAELKLAILKGQVGESDMKQSAISNENKLGKGEAEGESKGDQKSSKGKLAAFFQGIAGPLESVAGGLLMISIAFAILNTIKFTPELMITMMNLMAVMLFTFVALAVINAAYLAVQNLFDVNGEKDGSILNIIKQFAIMVGLTAGTLLFCGILVKIIQDQFGQILLGLLVIFGTAFITLLGLSLLAKLMKGSVDEQSPLQQFVKLFTQLIITITVLALLCFFLHDIINQGLMYSMSILFTAMLMIGVLTLAVILLNQSGVTAEQINAFKGLMIVTIVLIGILAILTIILGIIPEDIIQQGLIATALLVGLVVLLIGMLAIGIKAIQKVEEEKLWALMGILIVTTVMIAILAVLVIVLGSIELSTIIQGMIVLAALMVIPFVVIKVMSKLGQQAAQMVQALLGIAVAGIVTLALAAVGFLIVSIFADFTLAQVLTAVIAVTLTTMLLIVVGAAALALAAFAMPLVMATPMALLGIATASVLAIAIAGVAALLAVILKPDVAQAAIAAASAIILTITALLVVGAGALVLAGLAIPVMIASALALTAIKVIAKLLIGIAATVAGPILFASLLLQTINMEAFQTGINAIDEIIKIFTGMVVVITAFVAIGAALALNLAISATLLVGIVISLTVFVISFKAAAALCNLLPENPAGFEKIGNAVVSLNNFSKAVNAFTAPNLLKLIAIDFTLGFVARFAKQLAKLGDDGTIDKVQNLATGLAELAGQASGMNELAAAIRSVAQATTELNEVNAQSKISAEALSGQALGQKEMLQEIKESAPVEDGNGKIFEEMLTILKSLNDNMTEIRSSLNHSADIQEKSMRLSQGKTQFMQD